VTKKYSSMQEFLANSRLNDDFCLSDWAVLPRLELHKLAFHCRCLARVTALVLWNMIAQDEPLNGPDATSAPSIAQRVPWNAPMDAMECPNSRLISRCTVAPVVA